MELTMKMIYLPSLWAELGGIIQLYCHSKPDKALHIFHGSEAPSNAIDLGSLFCTEINAP